MTFIRLFRPHFCTLIALLFVSTVLFSVTVAYSFAAERPCNEFFQLTGTLETKEDKNQATPLFTVQYTDRNGTHLPFSGDYTILFHARSGTPGEYVIDSSEAGVELYEPGHVTYRLPSIAQHEFPVHAHVAQTVCGGYNLKPQYQEQRYTLQYPGTPTSPVPDEPETPIITTETETFLNRLRRLFEQLDWGFITTFISTSIALIIIVTEGYKHIPTFNHLYNLFASFLSREKKGLIGIVVDGSTGAPLAGTIVQAFDAEARKLLKTEASDQDGRFGFLIPTEKPVYFSALLKGYSFPSKKKPPIRLARNAKLYTGSIITISETDLEEGLRLVIPMQQLPDTVTLLTRIRAIIHHAILFLDRISWPLTLLTFALNTYFFVVDTNWLNTFFQIIYIVVIAIKIISLTFVKRMSGVVIDGSTGNPIDLAPVRAFNKAINRIITTRITNLEGRYSLFLPKGSYLLTSSKTGYNESHISLKVSGRKSKSISTTIRLNKKPNTPEKEDLSPPAN